MNFFNQIKDKKKSFFISISVIFIFFVLAITTINKQEKKIASLEESIKKIIKENNEEIDLLEKRLEGAKYWYDMPLSERNAIIEKQKEEKQKITEKENQEIKQVTHQEKTQEDYKYNQTFNDISKNQKSDYIEVSDSGDRAFAWTVAQKEVKSMLKSPSTAKFPFSSISNGVEITHNGTTYIVNAYVDAQNSFGAEVRNNFTVKFEKLSEESYNLIDISIY